MMQACITFLLLSVVALIISIYGTVGMTRDLDNTFLWIFFILSTFSFVLSLQTGGPPMISYYK